MISVEEILATDQVKLILGFLVGAIIGLERQLTAIRREKEAFEGIMDERELRPGVRTVGLVSLYGTLTTIFSLRYNLPEVLYFSIASVLIIIGIYTIMKYQVHDYGLTTPVSLAISYVLGMFVGVGEISLAVTLSVLVTFILTSKRYVVNFLRGLEFKEIRSALEIGILFFLLFPIIPNTYDPFFQAINLRILYLFMVTVLTLSFFGYILVKSLPPVKGILSFAALGALFSSEGVTVNLTRLYNEEKSERMENVTRLGFITANLVMIARTIALTALLLVSFPRIILDITLLILPSIVLGLILIGLRYFGDINLIEGKKLEVENPLSYGTAAKFVLAFIGISFVVVFLQRVGATFGVYFGSFFGGLVSNLAVSLSVASLVLGGEIGYKEAEISIILGTLAAIMNKTIYVRVEAKDKKIFFGAIKDILVLALPLVIALYLVYYV